MTALTSRERIIAVLEHREPDRLPMLEICYWPPTVQRWRTEGLPADVYPEQYFELGVIPRMRIDCSLQLEVQTLEESDEWVVERDRDGAVHKRWKDHYATCAELDQLVKTRADWERVRERLTPTPERLPANLAAAVGAARGR